MVKIKKAQRGGCLSTTSSSQRTKMYKQAAGEGSSDRAYRKELRQAARAERKEARAAKKEAPAAKAGKTVKKAQRGGCVSTMSSKERTNLFRGGTEAQLRRASNKQERENARAERKEARVEKRAAKKVAPAKYGKMVKKAVSKKK